ncbi:MAG: undecaprenyl-diphosphate phosphatase, partial [Clostridia bacterium]|nr:undecaprenyl-diphosphate phosphatase [Clostridia bacterium]
KVFHKKFKLTDYTTNERMVIMVLIGTVPLVIAAFLGDTVEFLSSYTLAIGIILIFNSVMLFVSDKLARGGVNNENVKPRNALVVGLCQVLAIMPGLSRSGTTITAGLTQKFDREFAVKYSFILSIPAIIGANITSIPDIMENPIPSSDVTAYIVGAAVAFVCGVAAMKLLILISRKANFRAFSYYTFAVGVIAIILGITGTKFPINI